MSLRLKLTLYLVAVHLLFAGVAVYLLLQMTGIWPAFGWALAISTTTHALTWLWFKHKTEKIS